METGKNLKMKNKMAKEKLKKDALLQRVITLVVHEILEKGIDVFNLIQAIYKVLDIDEEKQEPF